MQPQGETDTLKRRGCDCDVCSHFIPLLSQMHVPAVSWYFHPRDAAARADECGAVLSPPWASFPDGRSGAETGQNVQQSFSFSSFNCHCNSGSLIIRFIFLSMLCSLLDLS